MAETELPAAEEPQAEPASEDSKEVAKTIVQESSEAKPPVAPGQEASGVSGSTNGAPLAPVRTSQRTLAVKKQGRNETSEGTFKPKSKVSREQPEILNSDHFISGQLSGASRKRDSGSGVSKVPIFIKITSPL